MGSPDLIGPRCVRPKGTRVMGWRHLPTSGFCVSGSRPFSTSLPGPAVLPRDDSPHVLEQDEQMHRIGRRRNEIKFLVKAPGLLVFRMHRECANARNLGSLHSALHRVAQ